MTDQFPPDPGDRAPSAGPTVPAPAPTAAPPDPGPRGRSGRPAPAPQVATELVDLLKQYAQQETLEPIRQVGKYLAWGVIGSVLLGFGAIFLAMAALRALQTETGSTFTGQLTWIPYFIVIIGLAVVAAIAWSMRKRKREQPR